MIRPETDGYYVSKLPDIYIESHGGASGEIKFYHFIKFYADDFFAKYSHEKYYQSMTSLWIREWLSTGMIYTLPIEQMNY